VVLSGTYTAPTFCAAGFLAFPTLSAKAAACTVILQQTVAAATFLAGTLAAISQTATRESELWPIKDLLAPHCTKDQLHQQLHHPILCSSLELPLQCRCFLKLRRFPHRTS